MRTSFCISRMVLSSFCQKRTSKRVKSHSWLAAAEEMSQCVSTKSPPPSAQQRSSKEVRADPHHETVACYHNSRSLGRDHEHQQQHDSDSSS